MLLDSSFVYSLGIPLVDAQKAGEGAFRLPLGTSKLLPLRHKRALVLTARKLVRTIFAMEKNGTIYRPQTERLV